MKQLTDIIKTLYRKLIAIQHDKLLHVVVSATLTAILSHIIPFAGLFLVMTFIFFAKEVYDKYSRKGTAEWGDVIADYVGFAIGIL